MRTALLVRQYEPQERALNKSGEGRSVAFCQVFCKKESHESMRGFPTKNTMLHFSIGILETTWNS